MHDVPPRNGFEMTERQLVNLLNKYGVPYHQWDGPGTKTVHDLLAEIADGEACLIEDEQGLTRVTNGLGLDVLAVVDGVRYRLVEAKQVFADGTWRHRKLSTSLGEKIKTGEDMPAVIVRALEEELGVTLPDDFNYSSGETETHPRNSGSYPGLQTLITLTHAVVELPVSCFNPEGYVEDRPGRKRIYFEWEPVEV